jgi:hypothetical protein
MSQRLTGVELSPAGLDLAEKPVVVLDGAFEGVAGQHLDRRASAAGGRCQLALQFARQVQFHGSRATGLLLSGEPHGHRPGDHPLDD